MARYLNTSMANQSVGDSPIGWLIPYKKSKERSNTLKEVRVHEEEEDEEAEEYETEE